MGRRRRPPVPSIAGDVVDSHCHLDPQIWGGLQARDALLEEAFSAGVRGVVAVGSGYGAASAHAAVETARSHPGRVWATVGLHPHDARLADGQAREAIEALARAPEVVALGEAGLDFHYDHSPRDVQREVLMWHVALASDLELPLVIHDRESQGETIDLLLEAGAFQGAGVLFHCFSGGPDEARRLLDLGACLSLPGVLTYPKAGVMREVAAMAPLDRLLVETDAPFLTPEPWRGHRNRPAWLLYTIAFLAELRGMDAASMANATGATARRFFRIPDGPPTG